LEPKITRISGEDALVRADAHRDIILTSTPGGRLADEEDDPS
jgi:hypothetical protein